jgi:hypothetical protein
VSARSLNFSKCWRRSEPFSAAVVTLYLCSVSPVVLSFVCEVSHVITQLLQCRCSVLVACFLPISHINPFIAFLEESSVLGLKAPQPRLHFPKCDRLHAKFSFYLAASSMQSWKTVFREWPLNYRGDGLPLFPSPERWVMYACGSTAYGDLIADHERGSVVG